MKFFPAHRAARACLTAAFALMGCNVPTVLAADIASAPQTAASSDATTVFCLEGPDAPKDFSAIVDGLVRQLSDPSKETREDAEIRICMLPPTAFDALEAAAKRTDLPAASRQRLVTIVARERPWQAARLRRAKVIDQEHEWELQSALEAYKKVGRHNPRWDEAARRGIYLFIESRRYINAGAAREPLAEAMAKGCDDPLVRFMATRTLEVVGTNPAVVLGRYSKDVDALMQSKYPAYWKEWAAIHHFALLHLRDNQEALANHLPTFSREDSAMLQTRSNEMLAFWPRTAKETPPPGRLLDVAIHILQLHQFFGTDVKEIYDRITPAFDAVLPDSVERKLLDGAFYTDYAWQGRGGDFAMNVTNEGWKKFSQRLPLAEAALRRAYDMDPKDPRAATMILPVLMGEDKDEKEMETWFKRAMAADPDDNDACDAKLYYLQPKWHGDARKVLRFANECFSTQNWRGGLPVQVMQAHYQLAPQSADAEAYFHQPAVWRDAQRYFVPYLRVNPTDGRTRAFYCYFASMGGHAAEARAQFKLMGQDVDPTPFGSVEELNRLRTRVDAAP